jgi:WD40 repeat protein
MAPQPSPSTMSEVDEPLFKYERVGADLAKCVVDADNQHGAVSCLALAETFVAVGLRTGQIVLSDLRGNVKCTVKPHHKSVTCLSIDAAGRNLASCGADGKIFVFALWREKKSPELIFEVDSPMTAVCLDPLYGRRRDKLMLAGGLAGKLYILNKSSWRLSSKEMVLHEGEGPIGGTIAWRGCLAAWYVNRDVLRI